MVNLWLKKSSCHQTEKILWTYATNYASLKYKTTSWTSLENIAYKASSSGSLPGVTNIFSPFFVDLSEQSFADYPCNYFSLSR